MCDLQDLQELQCFLIAHIGRYECKSKFLMCILANRRNWDIIAQKFYLFKSFSLIEPPSLVPPLNDTHDFIVPLYLSPSDFIVPL